MPLAIIRESTGRLVTIARDDVPPGWTPPAGCFTMPAEDLPPDIQREDQAPGPVPAVITPRQIRLWLVNNGIPLDSVEAFLTTDQARIEWEYATEIARTHPLVAQLGDALGLDAFGVDNAFREAANL